MDPSQTSSGESNNLIQRARNEFLKNNYEECLNLLNSVDYFIGLEEKLMHNKLIAEFYNNDLRSVNDIQNKLEEMIKDPSKIAKPGLAYLHYNYAVILYHKHQYKKALTVLRPLQRLFNSNGYNDMFLSSCSTLLMLTILCQTDHKEAMTMLTAVRHPNGKKYLTTNIVEESNQEWQFMAMWQLISHRVDVLNRTEVKLTMEPDSSEYSVLRAHQHFLKHDIQMAAKELSKRFQNEPFSISKNGEIQDTVLANNMGLIHFSVRHYAMAVRFFQCALNFDSRAAETVLMNPTVLEMSACRRPEILYNLGISMLYLERPQAAFDCLLVPLNYHHNNPRLWLRLAEACIMVHKANLKNKTNNNLLTASVMGSGMLRKFVLKPTIPKYKTNIPDSYAIPNPNLEFATLCLCNALILVSNMEEAMLQSGGKVEAVPSLPSNPMRQSMVSKLKCIILANISYSFLYLGEFTSALRYGSELFEQKDCPLSIRFIACMYCAEALIMLDRPLLPFISPAVLKDLTTQDLEQHATPGWLCTSLELAKAIFYYNGAVCSIMNENDQDAGRLLAQAFHPDIMSYVMKLKVYLDYNSRSPDLARNLTLLDHRG